MTNLKDELNATKRKMEELLSAMGSEEDEVGMDMAPDIGMDMDMDMAPEMDIMEDIEDDYISLGYEIRYFIEAGIISSGKPAGKYFDVFDSLEEQEQKVKDIIEMFNQNPNGEDIIVPSGLVMGKELGAT